jgi:hypothetical protein
LDHIDKSTFDDLGPELNESQKKPCMNPIFASVATMKSDNQSVSSASLISFPPSASISSSSVPIALKLLQMQEKQWDLGIWHSFCTTMMMTTMSCF